LVWPTNIRRPSNHLASAPSRRGSSNGYEGLERLSVEHHTTLPQTPEQNGKQELFFSSVEGRLMPMLEGEPHLTLELLNRATQASELLTQQVSFPRSWNFPATIPR
jgi:hypothetical protein